jgi:hypothetical protein
MLCLCKNLVMGFRHAGIVFYFFVSVASVAEERRIPAQDHSGQAQMQKEGAAWIADDKVNTYIEGIPPIVYQGKRCSQTQAAKINGRKSVSVNCYFTQAGVERQCSFVWGDIDNKATITVQSYESNTAGNKKISIQTNADVASRRFVKWEDVATTAQNMVNLYCGADLKKKKVTTHTEQPIAPLANGATCSLSYQWDEGAQASREITCYTSGGVRTQCTVRDDNCAGLVFFSGITKSVNVYDNFATAEGSKATTQVCELESSSIHLRRPNDKKFKEIAYEWLNKNCK